MADQSRRHFLKQLARGSVYAPSVVATLMAPLTASGQGAGSQMGMMMNNMMGRVANQENRGPPAPWFKPPPGR
jgi:proline dehydrogenase